MFSRKKIAELKSENTRLNQLCEYYRSNEKELLVRLTALEDKVNGTIVITQDAIKFAKMLQRFTKRRSCGSGGCGFFYQVPSEAIDKVARHIPHI